MELPTIAPAAVARSYRFVYAVRAGLRCFVDGLLKVDLHAARVLSWAAPGCAPSEPVFVARLGREPGAGAGAASSPVAPGWEGEDDGVVLSIVLETLPSGGGDGGAPSTTAERSFLLVLDGRSFTEISRAYFPDGVVAPMSFHGMFVHGRAHAAGGARGKEGVQGGLAGTAVP